MPDSNLSVSEYTILGIIWRGGPCTTYVVMRVLARSASTFYRNRASSTYRVVQRLISLGLLEPDGEEVGTRKDRRVRATNAGVEALRAWMAPPVPAVEVAHTVDLVRLRVIFLEALEPEARIAFLDDTLTALHDLAGEQEAIRLQSPNTFTEFGVLGALYETRARIAWLEDVKMQLSKLQERVLAEV